MHKIRSAALIILALLISAAVAWGQPEQQVAAAGTDADWLRAVQERLAAEELQPSLQNHDALGQTFSEPTWHFVNRATNLRSYFDGTSWWVQPRSAEGAEKASWSWRYSFAGLSRSATAPVTTQKALEVKINKEQATITYERADGLQEWYTNHSSNLEQGFLIKTRLPASAEQPSAPLRLQGLVHSSASLAKLPKYNGPLQALTFSVQNVGVLEYSGLKVVDARGELVRSWLEVRGATSEGEYWLDIVIDDAGAEYPLVVDPVASTPGWTAESDQVEAYFGGSVSTAGDVNGDGFSDVIVGAHRFDNGQADEGRAYLYFGSSSGLEPTPAWTAESNQTGAQFGVSVGTAGDVNGDGFSDVIVGAFGFDNGQADEGRAYLYFGSSSGLEPTSAWTAESNQGNAYFGRSVGTAGDVNGDGFSDVIVGASHFDNGQADEGRAYLYFGSSSGLEPTSAWTAESDQASAQFGYRVSTAGDVNGDGFSDVIVGAYGFDDGETDEGQAYLYLGSSSGLSAIPAWMAEPGYFIPLFISTSEAQFFDFASVLGVDFRSRMNRQADSLGIPKDMFAQTVFGVHF